MDTMSMAFKNAGISSEQFKGNEKEIFRRFPVTERGMQVLPDIKEKLDEKYKYKKQAKSALLNDFATRQDKNIIEFLRSIRHERLYVFPNDLCKKYFDLWIGYNVEFQRFVLRLRPNLLCGDLPRHLDLEPDVRNLPVLRYIDTLGSEDLNDLIVDIFYDNEYLVPVEAFDPILEINQMVINKTFHAETLNTDVAKATLFPADDPEMNKIRIRNRLHINAVEMFCLCNNIKLRDLTSGGKWVNLIHCSENFEDPKAYGYYIIV